MIERMLTGTVQPDDIDVTMNSYSVFIMGKSVSEQFLNGTSGQYRLHSGIQIKS